jgi:hypothetical protein
MPLCPAGHDSTADDYCDTCGTRIGGTAAPAAGTAELTAAATPCPECGAPRTGRFCEEDGYDFENPPPVSAAVPSPRPATLAEPTAVAPAASTASTWTAIVVADEAYFARVVADGGPDAAAMTFPRYCPERHFVLTGEQVRIGRGSRSRGVTPEIDLTGPPADPGVSHLHAMLLARPDGGWALVDPGSTNGTTLNEGKEPVPAGEPVPLADGDRIHLGAWTTVTLRRQGPVST